MKKLIKNPKTALFLTGLLQVTFVAMNVNFIAHNMIVPMLLTGFMISLIWTINVKRISIGSWLDRVIYSTGAMGGTGLATPIQRMKQRFTALKEQSLLDMTVGQY